MAQLAYLYQNRLQYLPITDMEKALSFATQPTAKLPTKTGVTITVIPLGIVDDTPTEHDKLKLNVTLFKQTGIWPKDGLATTALR